jgi:hypothetical protein
VRLTLTRHENGVETAAGNRVVYDVAGDRAHAGRASVAGRALVWELHEDDPTGAFLSAEVALEPGTAWLMRCDRVDFPAGGVAYTHTHPGPGIRCLLHGGIRIETGGASHEYGPLEAWFEPGPEPVFAAASTAEETAFVRVLLLPAEWAGKRTIRYVDPADAERPKTQRATVYLETPVLR